MTSVIFLLGKKKRVKGGATRLRITTKGGWRSTDSLNQYMSIYSYTVILVNPYFASQQSFVLDFESIDHLPLLQMLLNDFVEILVIDVGVPGLFGVNHHHRPLLTTIQTTGVINAYLALTANAELFATLFYIIARRLRTTLLTRLPLAIAQVGTEKHMVLVILFRWSRLCIV